MISSYTEKPSVRVDLIVLLNVCTSGTDALDLLQQKGAYESISPELCRPDLIFLDINMPRFSGWDFIEAYAALPDSVLMKSHANIMMLSTTTNTTTQQKALNTAYISGFVENPLRPDMLKSLVNEHLDFSSSEWNPQHRWR